MIRYKDLSLPLKLGIIGGFVVLIYFVITFLIGFFMGMFGVI